MDCHETTLKTWDKIAQQYQDVFMDLHLYDETYDAFCNLLQKKDAHILELACGPGNITKYLLNKRADYKILATDVAPSMLVLAEKNNPTAAFEILDSRNISDIKKKFDAIVCGFCIPYLSINDCKKLIQDCYAVLENDGLIYLSFIEGAYENSGIEKSSNGEHNMFVYYYSELFITKFFEENHFSVIEIFKIPYIRSNGEQSLHLIYITKKK